MIIVNFQKNENQKTMVPGLCQYDYGQLLRIQGLSLPPAVEIHFSTQPTGGEAVTRIGTTKGDVTDVRIPDAMLEQESTRDYTIYAFIYLTDDTSGQTEYKVSMSVKARPKPEAFEKPEDAELFRAAIEAVNESAERAEAAGKEAKKSAESAGESAKNTAADREAVEGMVETAVILEGKTQENAAKAKEYGEQALASAEQAILSERKAKEAEEAARDAQAGAEAAADRAEQFAGKTEEDRNTTEQAKALVMELGQQVADDKAAVEQAAEAFDKKAEQALEEVNAAGSDQVRKIGNTGDGKVQEINAAGDGQVQAVNTAGAAQVQAINNAGSVQAQAVNTTGDSKVQAIRQEGDTQVKNVQDAAAEITADREQIEVNRENVLGAASAIKKTAEGETIVVRDAAKMPFGLKLFGRSEQATTTGAQLLNLPDIEGAATADGSVWSCKNGIITVESKGSQISSANAGIVQYLTGMSGTFYVSGSVEGARVYVGIIKTENSSYQYYGEKSFSLDGTEHRVGAYIQTVSGKAGTYTVYPMLNAGSAPLPWEPYTGGNPSPSPEYPQPITSTGDGGSVNVDVMGGNMIDTSGLKPVTINGVTFAPQNDGSIVVDGTATSQCEYKIKGYKNDPMFAKGKSYFLSGCPKGGSASTYRINWAWEGANDTGKGIAVLFKEPASGDGTHNIRILVGKGTTCDNLVFEPMLTLGSASLPYEPYRPKQTLTLSTPGGLPGIPVSSGGNYTDEAGQRWICDEVEFGRGVYVQRVKEFVVDDTNRIISTNKYNTAALDVVQPFRVNQYIGEIIKNSGMYCEKFPNRHTWNNPVEACYATENTIDFNISNERLGTNSETSQNEAVEKLKQWLEGNPLKFLCCLSTPIENPLTDAELAAYRALHTNHPNTTVINGAGAHMEMEYTVDTESHIEKKVQEGKLMVDTITGEKCMMGMENGLLTIWEVEE